MNDQEKYENMLKMYTFANEKKMPISLKALLLYEVLLLSIKLDDYKFDLFDEYLAYP